MPLPYLSFYNRIYWEKGKNSLCRETSNMLPCSHTCSFKTVEEECWTAIQMTYKVIEDTLRIYVTSFLYIASLSVCAELSTLLGCISMNPGISFVFRLMSSYFWAPVIIRMTNLITTMTNVHSHHRVCGGDLLRLLQFNVTNNIKIRIVKSLLLWFYFANQKWYYF